MERTNVEVLDGGLILVEGSFDVYMFEPSGIVAKKASLYVKPGVYEDGIYLSDRQENSIGESLYGWTLREFAAVWAEALWRWRNPGGLRLDPSYRMPKEGEDV